MQHVCVEHVKTVCVQHDVHKVGTQVDVFHQVVHGVLVIVVPLMGRYWNSLSM